MVTAIVMSQVVVVMFTGVSGDEADGNRNG
jgi:hypothetical protein